MSEEKEEWNPRFVCYANSMGKKPEDLKYGRGWGAKFVLWIQERWREWEVEEDRPLATPFNKTPYSETEHQRFDKWLSYKYPFKP